MLMENAEIFGGKNGYLKMEKFDKITNSDIIGMTIEGKTIYLATCHVIGPETVNEFNELLLAFPHVDHEKVIKSIRAIEKIMFKKNIYRGVKTKIALAVWLSTNLTQDQVGEVLGISAATIRNLFHVVKRGVPIEMVNSDKIRFL